MVLFAALLAPAIFAAGLAAGETGRDERVGGRRGVVAGERPVVFGPVVAPAPAHPVRAFAAPVPAQVAPAPVVEEAPVVRAVVAPKVRSRTREPEDVVTETSRGKPSPTAEACPEEWEDTWLWEFCREHERRVAAGSRRRD
ncbi:hypothetical protein FR742_00205 [Nonomuraea sp. C10]|nr:hypothetical protein FR742_00205 [Nonomuraea sp. C10]